MAGTASLWTYHAPTVALRGFGAGRGHGRLYAKKSEHVLTTEVQEVRALLGASTALKPRERRLLVATLCRGAKQRVGRVLWAGRPAGLAPSPLPGTAQGTARGTTAEG
jgi:hypothetical protein